MIFSYFSSLILAIPIFSPSPNGRFGLAPEAIHPNGNSRKCMDVRNADFQNGTPVQIFDCNETPAQQWIIRRGDTKVILAGTGFCLDAGTNPANGVGLKIWTCISGLPAQSWVYTNDDRIALKNQGFCVDLTNGALTNGNQLQDWICSDFNANQIWTIPSLLD